MDPVNWFCWTNFSPGSGRRETGFSSSLRWLNFWTSWRSISTWKDIRSNAWTDLFLPSAENKVLPRLMPRILWISVFFSLPRLVVWELICRLRTGGLISRIQFGFDPFSPLMISLVSFSCFKLDFSHYFIWSYFPGFDYIPCLKTTPFYLTKYSRLHFWSIWLLKYKFK